MNHLRFYLRQLCSYVLNQLASEMDEDELGQSATIFSPHQDDETLACGGTIIRKKRLGAEVKIVFMTDGRKSHSELMPENDLKIMRAREALAAGRLLGLEEKDITFLEFEDCSLIEHQHSAVQKVTDLLQLQRPDEVFIPSTTETYLDHLATNQIVVSAVRKHDKTATICEYPIWLWNHLPWVSMPTDAPKEILRSLEQSLISGLSLLRDFQSSVYIADVLQLKRAALDQYKSQMTRLVPDPSWTTLGDVSDGEFLKCFFREYEIFHKYVLQG